jgi:hypothetical protein
MAGYYSPKIVTNGLIFYYDFSNPKSYRGSGTSVVSLAGQYRDSLNYGATLYNGVSYSTANGGCIVTDGVDDWLEVTPVTTTASRTVDIVYKMNTLNGSWGPLWRSTDWRERVFNNVITLINSAVTYYNLNGPDGTTDIINICYSYSGTNARSYKNGTIVNNITMNSPMDTGNYTYRFGMQAGGSTTAYVNSNIYSIKFYDRQLTDDEIAQNFAAVKGRFGF